MSLRISRVLHAGYMMECGGTRILFDPIFENPFSRNCHAFPAVDFDRRMIRRLHLDAVFISHHHDDHCSLDSLNLLDRSTTVYLYCPYDELFDWIRELGFRDVRPLDLDVPVSVGSFEIIPRRALDADVDSIFQIKADGLSVLNVVDSWIDGPTLSLLKAEGPWDAVLWPFQTMREIEVLSPSRAEPATGLPPEWLMQLRELRPRIVVPSSCQFRQEEWSWYNRAFFPITYERFAQDVAAVIPGVEVVRMNPGISILLRKDKLEPSPPLGWVLPIGNQDVDYEYRPEERPPSTGEIARRFPALTESEKKAVIAYCREGVRDRYRELGPPEDRYFHRARRWRLSVYDHTGLPTHFHFMLNEDQMTAVEASEAWDWATEVPAFKLHAALCDGETLTSMYVRINDGVFPPSVEKELQAADVLEDPLVRCLFNREFGAYQKAQLARIKTGQM